tara:strand:+ start:130 stop:402 length:273 start_codon:yes stop_codon:yes gene_type:complete
MRRSKELRQLDRLSASRMFLERHVALSGIKDSVTIRMKLRRLGIPEDSDSAQIILDLIDSIGYQKMLANQPIATRFSAVKREIQKQKVWK